MLKIKKLTYIFWFCKFFKASVTPTVTRGVTWGRAFELILYKKLVRILKKY